MAAAREHCLLDHLLKCYVISFTQTGRIIISLVHHLYFKMVTFYLLTKNPACLISTTETPGSSPLHLWTSWSCPLISTSIPTHSMKILVPSLSFPTNSSNSSWSHKHRCEWSGQYSGLIVLTSLSSVVMDILSPQHILFQTHKGHRIYHHQILNNGKILKACILFYHHTSLSFLLTQVFLLKYFWTYNDFHFIHVMNFLLSTTSCLHFPFYPG